jgi:hypothetical protein
MNAKQKKLQEYLESCIDFTWYNTDGAIYLDTLNNVYLQCIEEYDCPAHRQMYWNWVRLIKERLLWLPSCVNVAFSYYDIQFILEKCWYKKTTDQAYQDQYYWTNLAKIIYSFKQDGENN